MKNSSNHQSRLSLTCLLTCLLAPAALGQLQYQQIKSFGFPDQSGFDAQGVIEGSDGVLYGVTGEGGLHGYGTVFKMNKDGSGYHVLHAFPESSTDGGSPGAPLLEASDGDLYGTTQANASAGTIWGGKVFKLKKDGTGYIVLRTFIVDDAVPSAPLVEGSDGVLYGATAGSGLNHSGTVFKLNKDGSGYALLNRFWEANGDVSRPGPLIAGMDGALYGADAGTVFRLDPDGSDYAELLHFADTWRVNVVEGSDGVLYGTTSGDGPETVFRLNKDGSGYTQLHIFTEPGVPTALVSSSDEALYGIYFNGGLGSFVFRLNKEGSGYTNLHSFTGAAGTLVEGRDGLLYAPGFRLNKDGSGFAVLHYFTYAGGDGTVPTAPLVEGRDGMLYGTTSEGGATRVLRGGGTVFKLNKDGSGYTLLHQFNFAEEEGSFAHASVIEGSDGILYGTASREGTNWYGRVFKLNHDGTGYSELRRFSGSVLQQGEPHTTLVEGSDGALYGTTYPSGTNNAGTVFKLNKDATGFIVLHEFGAIAGDASRPYGPLVEGSDGALYGTGGTVFKVNKDGTAYAVLPIIAGAAGLVEGTDEVLYGTSAGGGIDGVGAVFKFNKDGSGYEVLHSFTLVDGIGVDGVYPSTGLVEGSDGALYGTTREGGTRFYGTAFKLNKDGSGFTVLHNFLYKAVQGATTFPYASLSRASDGSLYGVTAGGGEMGIGNIFVLRPTGPRLTLASILPGGQFRYTLLGEAGCSYTIQVSPDLVNWTALTNFQSTTGTNQLTDQITPNYNSKFYRAVSP